MEEGIFSLKIVDCNLTMDIVFSNTSLFFSRCRSRRTNAECFRSTLRKFLKRVLDMFIFFSWKKMAGEREESKQYAWGPCVLVPRQYEILHLAVIQSWTHLVLYGKSSGGVEIFTRRITKFREVFSGCKIRCIPRQRCETRSSWRWSRRRQSGYCVYRQREGRGEHC